MVKYHGESALIYRLDFEALSELEQNILLVLLHEKKAFQAWEIYKYLIIIYSEKEKPIKTGRMEKAAEITQLAYAFIVYVLLVCTVEKKVLDKIGAEAYAIERRKEGAAIPSFPKIQKTIISLKREGILKKRQVRGRIFYSLNEFVKAQLAKRFVIS